MSLLSSLCVFVLYTDECMCKLCFATNKLEGHVCHVYGQHGRTSHLMHERWHFSLLISSFIPLFIFSPHISPGLPSSHPNRRTHRHLLGTPCPGNPPCIARYLKETTLVD